MSDYHMDKFRLPCVLLFVHAQDKVAEIQHPFQFDNVSFFYMNQCQCEKWLFL